MGSQRSSSNTPRHIAKFGPRFNRIGGGRRIPQETGKGIWGKGNKTGETNFRFPIPLPQIPLPIVLQGTHLSTGLRVAVFVAPTAARDPQEHR